MNYDIPARVFVVKEDSIASKLDELNIYLKDAIVEEFVKYDEQYYITSIQCWTYTNKMRRKEYDALKIEDLPRAQAIFNLATIERLIYDQLAKTDVTFNQLVAKKASIIEADANLYVNIMQTVQNAFENQTALNIDCECRCHSRAIDHDTACPPFRALVNQLTDKKYCPFIKTTRHSKNI